MKKDRRKNSNCRYTIGVDFGGTFVKLALVRFCNKDLKLKGFSHLKPKITIKML